MEQRCRWTSWGPALTHGTEQTPLLVRLSALALMPSAATVQTQICVLRCAAIMTTMRERWTGESLHLPEEQPVVQVQVQVWVQVQVQVPAWRPAPRLAWSPQLEL